MAVKSAIQLPAVVLGYTGFLAFLLSAVISGLSVALLMGTVVVAAVGKNNPKFVGLACINIMVATNAGGSFSPLGGHIHLVCLAA